MSEDFELSPGSRGVEPIKVSAAFIKKYYTNIDPDADHGRELTFPAESMGEGGSFELLAKVIADGAVSLPEWAPDVLYGTMTWRGAELLTAWYRKSTMHLWWGKMQLIDAMD